MSAENQPLATEHAALAAVLDTYGADLARWPAAERLRFAPLLAADPVAQRLRTEALAFERLMDLVPQSAPASSAAHLDALTERIMAAAVTPGSERRGSPIRAEVSSLRERPEVARPAGGGRLSLPTTGARAVPQRALPWPALSLMAASLLVGIVGGASGAFERIGVPWLGGGAVAAGDADLDDSDVTDETEIAFNGDDGDLIEEDVW